MKKYLLNLILFIPIYVNAQTFYTDYQIFEENSSNYYEANELLRKEEIIVYNNYYEKPENDGYHLENYRPDYSYFIDYSDFQNSYNYIKAYFSNSIGPFTTQRIRKYDSLRYLRLRDFYVGDGVITNIKIYYQNIEIPFKIIESNFNYFDNLSSSSKMIIDLSNQYLLKDISLKIYFNSAIQNRLAFMLDTFVDYLNKPTVYSYYTCESSRAKVNEEYLINFILNEEYNSFLDQILFLKNKNYNDIYYVSYFLSPTKLYKYYKIIKESTNIYTEKPLLDAQLDYNDSLIQYNYYNRDKIILRDIITSLADYNNLIIDSTIEKDKITIIESIDLNINQEYFIKLIMDNYLFEHEITVNIPEIPLSEIPKEIKEEINIPVIINPEIEQIAQKSKKTESTIKNIISTTLRQPQTKTSSTMYLQANLQKNNYNKSIFIVIGLLISLVIFLIYKHKKNY